MKRVLFVALLISIINSPLHPMEQDFEFDLRDYPIPERLEEQQKRLSTIVPQPFTSPTLAARHPDTEGEQPDHFPALGHGKSSQGRDIQSRGNEIILTEPTLPESKIITVTPIDKEQLSTRIKDDLYKMHRDEVIIGGIDWLAIAHGNEQLAIDLKELYRCPECESAQEKVAILCKKWGLKHITIGE